MRCQHRIIKKNLFSARGKGALFPAAALILAAVLAFGGCSSNKRNRPVDDGVNPIVIPHENLLESSYNAGDILAQALKRQSLPMNRPMLASSLVNIDNLEESSTFGRLVSEQIASRLAQHGYPFVELKLRQDSVFIKEGQGEFLLSRELRHLGETHDAAAVLVGTYAVTEDLVFVSVRLVRTQDNTVIAGHDYQLYNSDIVESLLR
ncbi:hypothetical protein Dalk_0240 [Desulfatibacillum aliphaticivorans]|uniref:FlgO domain-containing protein n=1 Tax=Desulfatibacillum aliphaticivorans TaxID=218208 RepID=B8FMT2_DESAL|nr:FlgO family outer membrane protein [Desulfatibacillum aliphaticivorans]ACL01949.1 hypothetical protein Dalk_0240 [Desulfatibacillum aliphaticivorans]